ncbi:MAG TPA: type II toxin-antitoxin system RelE/ParE family toxin, partial [Patescibacteria group bacterium]|nr:type II toxin-antitoxin system RelE/ParE family toxin [Patescibacteria group bacterium]
LRLLPPKHQRQVAEKLLQLQIDPRPADSQKLTDSEFYRATVGEYRIVYRFDASDIQIALIEKRDIVYKRLKRK